MKLLRVNVIPLMWFLGLFVISCEKSNYINLNTQPDNNINVKVEFESVRIHIDSITYQAYAMFQNAVIEGTSYLTGYNKKTHSFDIFNLDSRQFYKHLVLERRGPNGIEFVDGFYFHNWDSIFVYGIGELLLIDSACNVLTSYDIFSLDNVDFQKKGSLVLNLGMGLIYSPSRNSVIFRYIPRNVKFKGKEYYEIPFLAEFFLDNNLIRVIPVSFSNYIKSNYLGHLDMPFLSLQNENIYYCFSGESNIYTYDLDSDTNRVFGGRSSYTKNLAKATKPRSTQNATIRYLIENISFFNLRYDPFNEIYYRLHFGDIKYKISKELNTTFRDKSLYLMIFNKNMELIIEKKLDDYTYIPEFYGVCKDGIILNANHDLNKDFCTDSANFKLLILSYEESN